MSLPNSGPVIEGTLISKNGQQIVVRDPRTVVGLNILSALLVALGATLTSLLVGAWLDIIPAVNK